MQTKKFEQILKIYRSIRPELFHEKAVQLEIYQKCLYHMSFLWLFRNFQNGYCIETKSTIVFASAVAIAEVSVVVIVTITGLSQRDWRQT